jgi:hypothetical protein
MPGWLQLAIAIVALIREVLKYFNEREKNKVDKLEKIKSFKDAIHTARGGDSSDLERLFMRDKTKDLH